MKKKLSILICSLDSRRKHLNRLLGELSKQTTDEVEIVVCCDKGQLTIGEKRNLLIKESKGEYFCFIDDDDMVHRKYIYLILNALENDVDVVTLEGWMTTNGRFTADWVIKLGEKYEARNGILYRFPNHLCCFKKEVVKKFKFEHISNQEDYRWALAINNSGVLKTEFHIPQKIYHYDYISKKAKR